LAGASDPADCEGKRELDSLSMIAGRALHEG